MVCSKHTKKKTILKPYPGFKVPAMFAKGLAKVWILQRDAVRTGRVCYNGATKSKLGMTVFVKYFFNYGTVPVPDVAIATMVSMHCSTDCPDCLRQATVASKHGKQRVLFSQHVRDY